MEDDKRPIQDALRRNHERHLLKAKKPMKVQSLVFDKKKFSESSAKSWASSNGFSSSGVDETENSYRIRQKDPGRYKTFRTIELKPGVKAVIGKSDDEPVVYLVRHGHTDLNGNDSDDRIRGWQDIPLNDSGVEDAEKAARALVGKNVKKIYSSDLRRAEKTAHVIGDKLGLLVDRDRALRPWNLGNLQGELTKSVLPEMNRLIENENEPAPGGEPFGHFRVRFLSDLRKHMKDPGGPSLLVTHYRNMKALEAWAKAGYPDDFHIDEKTMMSKGDDPGSIVAVYADGKMKHLLGKQQPSSSDVHVNAPLGSERKKKSVYFDTTAKALGSDRGVEDEWSAGENPDQPIRTLNDVADVRDMQEIVDGMDYELSHHTTNDDDAFLSAVENLSEDPDFYRKRHASEDRTEDVLQKDENFPKGIQIDLGNGNTREPGHIGIDLYPHDPATVVHDLHLGIPFPDECASRVNMANSLHCMDELSKDPKPLLSEIQRVLMPGGQFYYEGPNELFNYPEWLVMTHYEDNQHELEKADGKFEGMNPIFRQQFTRIARPDAATAQDAEPRIGISQYDQLPSDALLAMDALGYYYSDATSSGRGNRVHGYPSQGALAKVRKSIPIAKIDRAKQIVYGVVLAPDEVDSQEDWMPADEIEKAAHAYMENSRVIGKEHSSHLEQACPVESYIAPIDFEQDDGPYGPQSIKKGSWILGVKIKDPKEWKKVVDGEYQGFSVGGLGMRTS